MSLSKGLFIQDLHTPVALVFLGVVLDLRACRENELCEQVPREGKQYFREYFAHLNQNLLKILGSY